jgi:hypothetical protein
MLKCVRLPKIWCKQLVPPIRPAERLAAGSQTISHTKEICVPSTRVSWFGGIPNYNWNDLLLSSCFISTTVSLTVKALCIGSGNLNHYIKSLCLKSQLKHKICMCLQSRHIPGWVLIPQGSFLVKFHSVRLGGLIRNKILICTFTRQLRKKLLLCGETNDSFSVHRCYPIGALPNNFAKYFLGLFEVYAT